MKRLSLILAMALVISWVSSSSAITGLGFGVRGGMVRGYDDPGLKTNSVDFSNLQMLGAHLKIGTLRIVDLELAAEYSWNDKSNFTVDTIPGVDLTVADIGVYGSAKFGYKFSVLKPYIGGGVGFHRLVYKWTGISSGVLPDDTNKFGWHALGGVSLKPPIFPLEFFVEGRYTSIQTPGRATNFKTWMAGVTFNLP